MPPFFGQPVPTSLLAVNPGWKSLILRPLSRYPAMPKSLPKRSGFFISPVPQRGRRTPIDVHRFKLCYGVSRQSVPAPPQATQPERKALVVEKCDIAVAMLSMERLQLFHSVVGRSMLFNRPVHPERLQELASLRWHHLSSRLLKMQPFPKLAVLFILRKNPAVAELFPIRPESHEAYLPMFLLRVPCKPHPIQLLDPLWRQR